MKNTIKPKSAWTSDSIFHGVTAIIQCGDCYNLWKTKVPYINHICLPCPNCGAMNEEWLEKESKKIEKQYIVDIQRKKLEEYSDLTDKNYKNRFRNIFLTIIITSLVWLGVLYLISGGIR
jgi:hypothetical protein